MSLLLLRGKNSFVLKTYWDQAAVLKQRVNTCDQTSFLPNVEYAHGESDQFADV